MPIEVVFEKRINNATVYRDADVGQRRQYFLLICLTGLFVFGLLFYGWQQYTWRQLGYEIEKLQKKQDDLLEYQHQLVLERDSLARPERIASIARNDLGMVVAAPGQLVMMETDSIRMNASIDGEEAAPLSAATR
jgi:cell division protein FtsL